MSNLTFLFMVAAAAVLDIFFGRGMPDGVSFAVLPAMAVPIAMAAAPAIGSLVTSMFGKKKSTTVKEDPRVSAARQKLYEFMNTGQFGDFKAGEAYTGSLGDFNPTGIESASLGKLGEFVSGTNPALFSQGESTLTDLLSTDRFDPFSATGEYAPFKQNIEKQLGEGATRLKRNAAFSRSLYSGNTVKQLGKLEEEGQNQLTGKLAELYDQFVGRKINAIPQAFAAAGQEQDMAAQRLGAGFQYGGLERDLGNQEAQSKLAEFVRQRGEMTMPINAAQSVMGSGFSEFKLPGAANPLTETLGNYGQVGIQELIRQMFAKGK